jgi:hypothetical protein
MKKLSHTPPSPVALNAKRERPHGTRLRYLAGCKCVPCRAANSNYEVERAIARQNGDWNGYVRAEKTRAHLQSLSAQGVGYKSVAKAAGVSKTVLAQVLFAGKSKIRARTERKVLKVTQSALPQSALLPAEPFWKLINDLRKRFGYSKKGIAQLLLGHETNALQLRTDRITLANARKIMRLHESLTKAQGPVIVAVTRGEYMRSSLSRCNG